MILFLACLTLALLIFLFVLHMMTREDYALMRRNISMEQFYNAVFLSLLSSLLFARLFFVIFHFRFIYLNPVVFFALPYFPGISLFGAVLGLFLGLSIVCYTKQYPWKKFFDFFAIAFSCGLPVVALGTNFLHTKAFFLPILISVIFYLCMGVLGLSVFYRRILVNTIKDGTTTILFIMSTSIAYLFQEVLRAKSLTALRNPESILFVLLFVSQVIILLYLLLRKRKVRV